jgi:predicted CxxxxCH...CXXCH cytochrome family protein
LTTIGAHQAHVRALSGISSPVACSECHVVPATVNAAGHVDASPAEVTFGALASLGTSPVWNNADNTCSNTYCHGANIGGGSTKNPVWTQVDGSQVACDACHGNPPPSPHPPASDCGMCHALTALGATIRRPEFHVNGSIDLRPWGCNDCHGNVDNNAPPVDTNGQSATTLITVGAHQSHLKASAGISSPVACEECHKVPLDVSDDSHIDSAPAEVTLTELAAANGATPDWNRDSATCSGVYCHGATLNGGSNKTPLWTQVDGTQAACGTCHALALPTGQHSIHEASGITCRECHDSVTTTSTSITGPALHINGANDVALRNGGIWYEATKSCASACHSTQTW